MRIRDHLETGGALTSALLQMPYKAITIWQELKIQRSMYVVSSGSIGVSRRTPRRFSAHFSGLVSWLCRKIKYFNRRERRENQIGFINDVWMLAEVDRALK